MKVTYEDEVIPFYVEHTYRPDLRVSFRRNDETVCFVEFKGGGRAFSQDVRQRLISCRDQHPDKKFFIVFYKDGKCGPIRKDGSYMVQSEWASKNGFDFCVGVENIPEEWFNPEFKVKERLK